jgi:prepilin-type N-terminal cleavage/methylation domain-containing protein
MFGKAHFSRTKPRQAFTLVELLVVIGIIALLISILMPALVRVREASNRTACLSNVAQLAKAVLIYVGDNRGYLPDAGTGNDPNAYLSPRAVGLPAWTTFGSETYVLPSIGGLLQKQLGENSSIWRCPSVPAGSFQWTGSDPLAGTAQTDRFKPNYLYMASKESVLVIPGLGYDAYKFHLADWAVRNVSGLKVSRLASQPAANIVLFYDRSPSYHALKKGDIYAGVVADYYASYGYLDGHADGRGYANFKEYLEVFHRPIAQQWFGMDFSASFQPAFAKTY